MPRKKQIRIQPNTNPIGTVKWSNPLDGSRQYITDNPSPSRFAQVLRNIDSGNIRDMMELNLEMEAKDSHLHGVVTTRRKGLTALDWTIEPSAVEDQVFADEVASFIAEELENLKSFEEALDHFATGIGPNLAVVENIWENNRLIDMVPVPGHRLNQSIHIGPELRVFTDSSLAHGVETHEGKFIVHTPHGTGAGFPFRSTPLRAGVWLYLMKWAAKADWASFQELFAIPFRIAKYDGILDDDSRTTLQGMLRDMASDGWIIVPTDVEIETVSVANSSSPHSDLIEWIERKQSILYLGQTLTTEHSSVGSLALGRVHDNVRTDLLLSDVKAEARMLRNGLFAHMTALTFPGKIVPLPHFKRVLFEKKDTETSRMKLDQLQAAIELQLPIDEETKYRFLEIPMPKNANKTNILPEIKETP